MSLGLADPRRGMPTSRWRDTPEAAQRREGHPCLPYPAPTAPPPRPALHVPSCRGRRGPIAESHASCPGVACAEARPAFGATPISRSATPESPPAPPLLPHRASRTAVGGPATCGSVASCRQAIERTLHVQKGSGGFRKRKHDNFPHGQRREEKENVNPSSALMTSFKSFQLELDTRHDKYERLVKLSRDVTIESKRTIFLLHRFTSAPNGEEILKESEVKLDAVRQKIKQVAQELIGEDMYQFHRAISPGLQEYVEAVSFQYFIKTRSLISVEEINKQLIFTAEDREETTNTTSNSHDKQPHTWSLKVTPVDYLLGVADLTGELMRLCISSVGNGDIDTPFELSQFLRQIYDGFTFIGNTGPYEVSKKLYTLKQSLAKVENACYTLKVRGSEIPKHMLADVFSTKTELIDQDEGLP
ncbi:translin-associated protein X [Neopelma chrysocephalum]|nr:translin-associated protein X [Neopelma chrysocephalum]